MSKRTITEYVSDEIPGIVFDCEEDQIKFDNEFKKLKDDKNAAEQFLKCNHYASFSALHYALLRHSYNPIRYFSERDIFLDIIDYSENAIEYKNENDEEIDDPTAITFITLLFNYLSMYNPDKNIVVDVDGYTILLMDKKEK